ncbi:hypothetical protein LARI1_G009629 [Lachnellula arida]|uniref:Heterokaryon incompatibility domain-containing protein n=1 Tax=Lachnellula arida TaxID=1316785 RepID=A0A8T9AXY8_9HELO|nr:hypothetical protein LARI1_G009629 [Lachnellula arida]
MEKYLELCDTCQEIKLEDYLYQANYPGTVELGRFQDVAKKNHCSLCRLVIQALNSHSRQHWKSGIYPVEVCYLGRYNEKSNRPVLEVWFNSTSETLPDGMWGHSTTLSQILPLHQQLVHDASKARTSACAQLVGEKVDISRIRGWMKSCASLHGPNCNPHKLHFSENLDLSLLLVDVRRMRLAECGWASRYVALSYVWGSSQSLKSTKANIHHLQKDGAVRELWGELPQAIKDAIELTDAMGETYLWVDALCIIQDDNRSKAVYIACMNQIYGNAHVTLVTLNDPSADSALLGVAHSRILIQSPVEINGLHLVPRLPQLSTVEQYSAWSCRAWTFQEGILSRRCLYFAEHQVFWQCRTTYQSEDCPDNHDQDASDFVRGRKTNALERETGNDVRRQFNVYESLVKQYSPRALTFPADSLSAFTGVLSAMAESFSWNFASALPEPAFDLALLWRPMFGATMRPRPFSGQKAGPLVCTSPTWCWTAWHGNLFWDPWRLGSFAAQRVSLKTEVASFWIQDFGGLRPIRRGRANDSDVEIAGYKPGEHTAIGCALVFEAKTIDTEVYNISAPRMDQCALWNSEIAGGGLSSYFCNNMSYSLWIYDDAGQHCGTFSSLGRDSWPKQRKDGPRHDIVLLSRSSQDKVTQAAILHFQDHLPLEYPSDREYYEEIFDTRHYRYKNDWALNVMLVRWENDLVERVTVGQMHADAWKEAHQKSKLITLV